MPPQSPPDTPPERCPRCSALLAEEYALQVMNRPEDNTYLPAASGQLTVIKDFKPYGSRKLQLQRCPRCGTYYLYKTDYEYLVNGATEDEEFLTRLTDAQAAEYLQRPAPG